MRTRSALFVLALLIALPVWAATQPAGVEKPAVASADQTQSQDVRVERSLKAFFDELSPSSVPHCPCASLDGLSCTVGSGGKLCWRNSYEPGFCPCIEGTYSCA